MNKTLVSFLLLSTLPLASLANPAPDFTELVKQTKDSVVSIEVESHQAASADSGGLPPGMPDLFEHFFGIPSPHSFQPYEQMPQQDRVLQGQGSGFIIDEEGYLLTNAHVVYDADTVTVKLNTQREYDAEVIGLDKSTDIALLKIDATNLPAATLGNSDEVEVGDWVLAMGSPFGFDYTATQGIVSATARSLPNGTYVPFIQTDAAVNPGNSGGPLFNVEGEVIAINSQIYSRSGAFNGLAFSIPINVAKNIADQLKDGGEITRGWLGVGIQNVDQQLAESFGMDKPQGALVTQVVKDSPAAEAELKPGDVILAIEGKTIDKSASLPPIIALLPAGEEVELRILRDGETLTIPVTIGDLNKSSVTGGAGNNNTWGIAFESLDAEARQRLGFNEEQGVLITEVNGDSPASHAGLKAGDILLAIRGELIEDPQQAASILEKASSQAPLPILIYRNGASIYIVLVP